MNLQSNTQVEAGLNLIRMGNQMIAAAEISEADVIESIKRIQDGDMRLYWKLSKKPGFIEIVMALANKGK